MSVTKEQVLEALRSVQDPDLHKDIVTLEFVKDVRIEGGRVDFTIELTTPACPVRDEMKAEAERGRHPAGEPEHERVDDKDEQADCHEQQRQREKLEDRPHARVQHPEDERDAEERPPAALVIDSVYQPGRNPERRRVDQQPQQERHLN